MSTAILIIFILEICFFMHIYGKYSEIEQVKEKNLSDIKAKEVLLEKREEGFRKICAERQIGFPWIAEKIKDYEKTIYDKVYPPDSDYYARSSFDRNFRKIYYKNIEQKKELYVLNGIINFYEYLYPHLKEFRKVEDESGILETSYRYTKEEEADSVHYWLTPEEYRKLVPVDRNQLALDRWKKRALTNWEIGKLYENYIGYLYEKKGYKVEYTGIHDKYLDRGRDLICSNKEEVLIIQCKNWSKNKTIYEKHIFQFYGSIFEYTVNHELVNSPLSPRKIRGIFYTTIELSEFARLAAKKMNIELKEKFLLDKDYPCIKCNINRNGEKIYHLPFDQQYDNTVITPPNEFYAYNCDHAEMNGFRRAKRYCI